MCPSWQEDEQRPGRLTGREACEGSPLCWTGGMLPQDGCMPRRHTHLSLPVVGIACEGHLPMASDICAFYTGQRLVQPGEAEAPGVNWNI